MQKLILYGMFLLFWLGLAGSPLDGAESVFQIDQRGVEVVSNLMDKYRELQKPGAPPPEWIAVLPGMRAGRGIDWENFPGSTIRRLWVSCDWEYHLVLRGKRGQYWSTVESLSPIGRVFHFEKVLYVYSDRANNCVKFTNTVTITPDIWTAVMQEVEGKPLATFIARIALRRKGPIGRRILGLVYAGCRAAEWTILNTERRLILELAE